MKILIYPKLHLIACYKILRNKSNKYKNMSKNFRKFKIIAKPIKIK